MTTDDDIHSLRALTCEAQNGGHDYEENASYIYCRRCYVRAPFDSTPSDNWIGYFIDKLMQRDVHSNHE